MVWVVYKKTKKQKKQFRSSVVSHYFVVAFVLLPGTRNTKNSTID